MKFTVENAAIFARKSHSPESKRFLPKPPKVIEDKPADKPAQPAVQPTTDFRTKVMVRVRKQMIAIQKKMDKELDADAMDSKVLKELTEALARLETIEQKLSGRASPGALRPRSEKSSRSRPSEPEPMPEADQESPETT